MDGADQKSSPAVLGPQQSRQYTSKDGASSPPQVDQRIHLLGLGSIGKLVAHSLRGITDPPPITLIAHRHALLDEWRRSKKELVIGTDGFRVPASGFDMELALPPRRKHGLETGYTDDLEQGPGSQAHEVAEQARKSKEVDFRQSSPEESTEPIHNLIVTVKAPRTVSALSSVRHRLLPTSTVCLLQNGMGIIDELNKDVFPDPSTRPNYIQGIITHGANSPPNESPFFTVHAGHGTIALGVLPRSETADLSAPVVFPPTARHLIRTLTRTPVLAAVGLAPLELLQQQLEKLAQNAVINPLTVLLDNRNGSILYNYALTRTMRMLLAEISLVLRSLPELKGLPNVQTRFSAARLETLVVGIAHRTSENISSMLADVRNARETEIKYLNGYIVRRGEELGISCPCNYMMAQLVMGKANMISKEGDDLVPTDAPDLTGERR